MASLQAQKRALRKAMSSSLSKATPEDYQSQSRKITETLLLAPWFRTSDTVSCFLSMPTGEVDTSMLVAEILRAAKTLFVPKVDVAKPGHMDFLKIYGEDDLQTLPGGVWGIREPSYDWKGTPRMNAVDPRSDPLDLILVPGVAFDSTLSRLGHGKGYYDQFISSYTEFAASRGKRRPMLVALALRQQILENGEVPVGEHDWKMDAIVSPDGVIANSSSSFGRSI
ncbi:5-formyltetrahydrofolate cyclo-ligase [Artomyces pyxidatus]|uniref:5-formyltetrahydrofolate cyclo-ligase n=1 Tax=Artomyces pyxidatus TaxID=48021 RepID=A0ACB8TG20_9AGAM|nr:5-formyltetrahydrofolate cyclo-ligase [Artomyces pyxidatus]